MADLELSAQQDELVDAVRATGKPVVVVLLNGRPLAITRVAETVPAILEGFYLGQEGGTAVGRGAVRRRQPGRQAADHVPARHRPAPGLLRPQADVVPRRTSTSRASRCSRSATASATRRSSSTDLKVTPEKIGPAGEATVTVDVANTGTRAGDEVVQLYIRDRVSSVTRPVKELRGFERVTLAAGRAHGR